jgi:hypothetical protein
MYIFEMVMGLCLRVLIPLIALILALLVCVMAMNDPFVAVRRMPKVLT